MSTFNTTDLAAYLQGLAANENRPCLERESLAMASDGLKQVLQLRGEASVMRLLLAEAAEFIDGVAAEQGLDFEDIDDSIRLAGQIRRAIGQVPA